MRYLFLSRRYTKFAEGYPDKIVIDFKRQYHCFAPKKMIFILHSVPPSLFLFYFSLEKTNLLHRVTTLTSIQIVTNYHYSIPYSHGAFSYMKGSKRLILKKCLLEMLKHSVYLGLKHAYVHFYCAYTNSIDN